MNTILAKMMTHKTVTRRIVLDDGNYLFFSLIYENDLLVECYAHLDENVCGIYSAVVRFCYGIKKQENVDWWFGED